MCTIADLVMGDTIKFFHDCNCVFTYAYRARMLFFDNVRTVGVFYSGRWRTFAPCHTRPPIHRSKRLCSYLVPFPR